MRNNSLVSLFGQQHNPFLFNDSFFDNSTAFAAKDYFKEDDKCIFTAIDMPGIKASDIDINVGDSVLTIKAERKDHYSEGQSSRSYSLQISIPTNVERDKISAHFEDGVLEFTMPKKDIKKEQKKLQVQTGNRLEHHENKQHIKKTITMPKEVLILGISLNSRKLYLTLL